MTDCKNCLHVAVCARYSATGGMVRKCQHYAEDINVLTWIPVTERLPKHGEIALCYMKFEEVKVLQWDEISAWWLGCARGDDWQRKYITHWMSLPEPPKGEDNG